MGDVDADPEAADELDEAMVKAGVCWNVYILLASRAGAGV
jgi:threonine/homoserine efflux transporter RhtA